MTICEHCGGTGWDTREGFEYLLCPFCVDGEEQVQDVDGFDEEPNEAGCGDCYFHSDCDAEGICNMYISSIGFVAQLDDNCTGCYLGGECNGEGMCDRYPNRKAEEL